MCDEDNFEVNYKYAPGWEVESTSQFKMFSKIEFYMLNKLDKKNKRKSKVVCDTNFVGQIEAKILADAVMYVKDH